MFALVSAWLVLHWGTLAWLVHTLTQSGSVAGGLREQAHELAVQRAFARSGGRLLEL